MVGLWGALTPWSNLDPSCNSSDGRDSELGWKEAMVSVLKYPQDSPIEGDGKLSYVTVYTGNGGESWTGTMGIFLL